MKTFNTRKEARDAAKIIGGKVLDSKNNHQKGNCKEFIGMKNGKAAFKRWAVKGQ